MTFHSIVIGSGFGGAVMACRLAMAGHRVLVLERGRRWNTSNFPRKAQDPWIWDADAPQSRNGWFDIRQFPSITVAQGAGVGGGSLVYANVSTEAKANAFDHGWPAGIDYVSLKPHYDEVGRFMEVQKVPAAQWSNRMKLVKEAAVRRGYQNRFETLDLAVQFDPSYQMEDWEQGIARSKSKLNIHGAAQGTCVHLGNCDIGCEANARSTLDLNYLFVAENKHGAEIRDLHLVELVEPAGGGYRVHFDRLDGGAKVRGSEVAKHVFLCAGSLGSTELLLKSREIYRTLPKISPRLGAGWSSNGDFLTPAIHPFQDVEASKGPTIATAINFHDGSKGGQKFWIQDGGVPQLIRAYLDRKLEDPTLELPKRMVLEQLRGPLQLGDPLRHLMPWFAQGMDAADGVLRLKPGKNQAQQLHLDWDVKKSKSVINAIVAMHKELALATGGAPLVPPTWSVFQDLITPHPLGGCGMADDIQRGVVNHSGEVFGYPGLYVMDGSVVPRALGVNPSRTIAALAERAAAELLSSGRLN